MTLRKSSVGHWDTNSSNIIPFPVSCCVTCVSSFDLASIVPFAYCDWKERTDLEEQGQERTVFLYHPDLGGPRPVAGSMRFNALNLSV